MLLQAEIDGDRLTDYEMLGFLFLMIIAGNETTTKLLGNASTGCGAIRSRRPDPRRPGAHPGWVEETLRYDGRVRRWRGRAPSPSTLHGKTFRAGDRVVLLVGSGNRDERVFPDADRFDIRRDTSAMLSFGHGTHFCLGAALARLEGRVALESGEAACLTKSTRPALCAFTRSTSAASRRLPTTVTVR